MRITVVESTPEAMAASASRDGESVGSVTATRREFPYRNGPTDRVYAEIRSLHVPERERRAGIGRALVAEVRAWAREHGYTHLSVDASAKPGTAGAQLYEAEGFTPRTITYDEAL